MILETEDVFQQPVTEYGEVIGIEVIEPDEIALWINGNKGSFTVAEFRALAQAMREIAKMAGSVK